MIYLIELKEQFLVFPCIVQLFEADMGFRKSLGISNAIERVITTVLKI